MVTNILEGSLSQIPQDPRCRVTRMLVIMRLVMVAGILITAFVSYHPPPAFFFVLGFFFSINFVYLYLVRWPSLLTVLSQVQVIVDVIITTFLVHYTGGVDSNFVFLYPLCILAAEALISGVFSQTSAVASALFYGLLVLLEYTKAIPNWGGPNSSYLAGSWTVTILYFFRVFVFGAISALGGSLTKRLAEEQSRSKRIEDLSSRVMSHLHCGVISTDSSEKIIYANAEALQILLCSFDKIVGKDWREVFKPRRVSDAQETYEGIVEQFRDEVPLRISSPMVGEKVVGFHSAYQYDEKGKLKNRIILFRDISGMLTIAKKLASSRKLLLMGELAAGIAHEIRNPLASIRGAIEVLKERGSRDSRDGKLLDIVLEESDRLNEILEDYLTYTQDKQREPQTFDLKDIVTDMLCILKGHPLVRESVRLHWDVSSVDTSPVCVDDKQIKQVLVNVCKNALEAMPQGGDLSLRIEVMDSALVRDGELQKNYGCTKWVRLDIEDTGEGMAEDVLDRLYEPFFSTKEDGHGIGLALCRRIVESYQGYIRVRSQKGKGTMFSIFFPYAQSLERTQVSSRSAI